MRSQIFHALQLFQAECNKRGNANPEKGGAPEVAGYADSFGPENRRLIQREFNRQAVFLFSCELRTAAMRGPSSRPATGVGSVVGVRALSDYDALFNLIPTITPPITPPITPAITDAAAVAARAQLEVIR